MFQIDYFKIIMAKCADANNEDIVLSRSTAFSDRLCEELLTLHNEHDFTDFSLKTGNKSVQCHRVIIAANSPVLKAMLKSQMKETTQKQIQLDIIPPQCIDILMKYMYTGEARIPRETLKDVVEAADFLQMDELKQMCIEQASPLIEPNNVIGWFKLSDKMNLTELLDQCSSMMISQLHQIKSAQEFLDMSISELNSYFSEAKRNDVDPDDVVGATLDWVDSDIPNRTDVTEDLLKTIPMEKCSLQCLEEETEKHAAIMDSNFNVNKLMRNSMKLITEQSPVRKKRSLKLTKPYFVLVGGHNEDGICNSQSWFLDPSSPISKFVTTPSEFNHVGNSICKSPEGFVVSGGQGSDICAMFNIKKSCWKMLTNLAHKRHAHGSTYVNKSLYVFSGFIDDCYQCSKSIEYLDEDDGEWKIGPDMPRPMNYPSLISTGDGVFALDSNDGKLFKLDIASKYWSYHGGPPGGKYDGLRMIQIGDQLMVLGGYENPVMAWYTPSTDTWALGSKPQLKHYFGAVLHHKSTIMLVGGHQQRKVESYDMNTGVWSICDWKMPLGFFNLHGFVYD